MMYGLTRSAIDSPLIGLYLVRLTIVGLLVMYLSTFRRVSGHYSKYRRTM